jgi:hypothetical protein
MKTDNQNNTATAKNDFKKAVSFYMNRENESHLLVGNINVDNNSEIDQ